MNYFRQKILLLAWAALICCRATAGEGVGEFSIPSVMPLTAAHLERLRELIKEDPEAAALAEAEPLLDTRPKPLAVIRYEGLVHTDARRIADVEHLRDMAAVARLMRYWQTTGNPAAAATLRRYVLAWATTYRPTGNDVNENKLVPLIVAYEALRGTFAPEARELIEGWVAELGRFHEQAVRGARGFNNRYTKSVRLLSLCGRALDHPEWVAAADDAVMHFVVHSLYPDGTSRDLKLRDTLTYHCSALKPPLELAMLSDASGRSLYAWESPEGGSLEKSVEYVVPYATGEATRRE